MAENPYSSQGGSQGNVQGASSGASSGASTPSSWPYGSSAYPGSQGGMQQSPQQGGGAQGGGMSMPYMPQGYQGGGQQMQQMPQQMQMPSGGGGYPGMYPSGGYPGQGGGYQGAQPPTAMLPANQESYIENILRLNLEKVATVYTTFENNTEWNAKVFRGELEAAGKDHIILNDNSTGTRYLILMVYVDYITFQGPINYSYPYA